MIRRTRIAAAALTAVLTAGVVAPSPATAARVDNGSFEAGDHTGWTIDGRGAGSATWRVYDTDDRPPVGAAPGRAPGPVCGDRASWAGQDGPVSTVLHQTIHLDADARHELGLTHFYGEDPTGDEEEELPSDLGSTSGTTPAADSGFSAPDTLEVGASQPNRQYRIDLLRAGADPFSVRPDDVLVALFGTEPGDPPTVGPVGLTADLSAWAGQAVVLRVAVATDTSPLLVMLDCITVRSTPVAPGTGDAQRSTPVSRATPVSSATPVAGPRPVIPVVTG